MKCYKYFTSSPNSNILVLLEEISWRKRKRSKSESFMETFYFNFIFKCIYFWWRLCDRHVNEEKFVDDLHWIDEKEMLDLVAIAQSSPGAIAVNGAIVVGYKLAGIAGVLVSILGTMLPPFVIISVISAFYQAFRSNFLSVRCWRGCRQE